MPLVAEVEVARRLVQQEHARLLGERAREDRPLALSAGERVDEWPPARGPRRRLIASRASGDHSGPSKSRPALEGSAP